MSRAAGLALTKALSKEFGPDQIRVNAILVGTVESGQWVRRAAARGITADELYAEVAATGQIPLGRVGLAAEFADPELYARAIAATGPAFEAIQNVGQAEFHRTAVELARQQQRDGLPLRAEINVVGYLARTPEGA